MLEECPCPLCHSGAARELARFEPHRVLRCQDCGAGYLSPRLTEEAMLASYQREDYFESEEGPGYDAYEEQERSLQATFRRLLRQCPELGGDLLELGCGYGYFLEVAGERFRSRTGTDYSPGAVERARRSGAQVLLGGLEEAPGPYDAICMFQVLEHIYQPQSFLEKALGKLRPGGALVAAVPNLDSPLRWLLGRRWPSYKVPEHVTYFTRATLAETFRRAGLVEVRSVPYLEFFPLSLLAGKFGLRLTGALGRVVLPVPTTSIACFGRRPGTGGDRPPAGSPG